MSPQNVSRRIIVDRLNIIDDMLAKIANLPLSSVEDFLSDDRNVSAAESNVRRALEALMDIGRHILAKGFADGVTEYKEIVTGLYRHGVLNQAEKELMDKMAGYRNRLVHLYHEVTELELYQICTVHRDELRLIRNVYQRWLEDHPEKVDRKL